MAKFNDRWTVGPHGPIEKIDDSIFTVAGEIVMPLGRFPRRMTLVVLAGGRTAIWSAMPLRDVEMAQIEALGRPSFLIVPGIGHRLDIRPWKARYPEAPVLCPPGARQAVEEAVPVDATSDILDDPDVAFVTVPGVGEREAALLIRRDGRLTLVVNDILGNVRHPHGIGAHIMSRLFGFGPGRPRLPRTARRLLLKDANALAAALRDWAATPGLARVVVSHGDVIADDPAGVLLHAADTLT